LIEKGRLRVTKRAATLLTPCKTAFRSRPQPFDADGTRRVPGSGASAGSGALAPLRENGREWLLDKSETPDPGERGRSILRRTGGAQGT
jgi:hypothetical protein